ncbi:hypothetical protein [Nonomuraea sp. NPDC002799]
MDTDPFEPPGLGLATSWAAILDDARHRDRPVEVHLSSGALFAGQITRRGDSLVTVEAAGEGKTYEHNLAIDAIVAISVGSD